MKDATLVQGIAMPRAGQVLSLSGDLVWDLDQPVRAPPERGSSIARGSVGCATPDNDATASSDGRNSDALARLCEEEALSRGRKDAIADFKSLTLQLKSELERSHAEISELRRELLAAQDLAAQRGRALESLAFISKIPACDICFEGMGSGDVWWMMKTACRHHVCTGCWKRWEKRGKASPGELRCPWNTCVQRDEAGGVLFDGESNSAVMPCTIQSEFTRDDLLEGIEHVHTLFEKTFEKHVFPERRDRDQVPTLLKGFLGSTENH